MQLEKRKVKSYFKNLLAELPDTRDNRGKKHNLAYVMTGVLIAILHGRKKISSIQRFLKNRQSDISKWTKYKVEEAVSDTQLRRIVREVDWQIYNRINQAYFGKEITEVTDDEWVAIDGKELKGGIAVKADDGKKAKRGEVVINAVRQKDSQVLAQTYYRGDKESEKIYVRELLVQSNLASKSVTMDALHCDPKTTSIVNKSGGRYLIQVKENQDQLMEILKLAEKCLPCIYKDSKADKGHGRIELRKSYIYALKGLTFADRWQESSISSLVVTKRKVTEIKTRIESEEISYRISNQQVTKEDRGTMKSLANAVRGHWAVEADNYVRDVTFGEDTIKSSHGNSTRIWAAIRTVGINLIRQLKSGNIQARIELWTDCPDRFFFSTQENTVSLA